MKHLFSLTLIPLLFIFFSLDVNWTAKDGLVFDTNYSQKSTSIISQYTDTQTISDEDADYLKRFGESRFYDIWSSLLKSDVGVLDQENDYASVINTVTNFYNLYKMLYPNSTKIDKLGSYIQQGTELASSVATVASDVSNILNQATTFLKGATIKINGKFNGNEQSLYAKYMNLNYGYYLVTFTNIPDESFKGTIIMAIPESVAVTVGGHLMSDVVMLNATENCIGDESYSCGIVVNGVEYEKQVTEYENNVVELYVTLPEEIINYVKTM